MRPKKNVCGSSLRGTVAPQQMQAEQHLKCTAPPMVWGLRDRVPLIFCQQLVIFSFPFQTCRINSVLVLPAAAVGEYLSNCVPLAYMC